MYSAQELVRALRNFTTQEPRVVILSKPNGPLLFIGIDGEKAAVRAYPDPPSHRSWSARPGTPHSAEDLWVTNEGDSDCFEAAFVMPVEDVIGIAAHVAEHGNLPDTFAWVNLMGETFR